MSRTIGILSLLAFGLLAFFFFQVIKGWMNPAEPFLEYRSVQVIDYIDYVVVSNRPLNPEDAAAYDAGQDLFKRNCSACHALDAMRIGPPPFWHQ